MNTPTEPSASGTAVLQSTLVEAMAPNGLDLATIAPQAGDKYSPNLHAWLAENRGYRQYARVFVDAENNMWIGIRDGEGWFHGAMLMRVLSVGKKTDTFAYPPGHFSILTEVADFWGEYVRLGRCAIDREHEIFFRGVHARFTEANGVRTCKWCGCQQHQPAPSSTAT